MGSIKSFVYLDEYKMYSISSQLFEGLTEYVLSGNKLSHSESEQQKGKLASGSVLGDILIKEQSSTEKRYFHDFAYNLFEDKLKDNSLLFTVDDKTTLQELSDKTFVIVSGKAIFNDYGMLKDTVDQFNSIGEAIGYMSYKDLNDDLFNLAKTSKIIRNPDRKAQAKALVKSLNVKYKKALEKEGLILDDGFIDRLSLILEYGYKKQLEFIIPSNENKITFSSILNREYLRETEDVLIAKYSRRTESEFKILGLITQTGESSVEWSDLEKDEKTSEEPVGFKKATQNIVDKIANVENLFVGRLSNECIIDPIAIYREL